MLRFPMYNRLNVDMVFQLTLQVISVHLSNVNAFALVG